MKESKGLAKILATGLAVSGLGGCGVLMQGAALTRGVNPKLVQPLLLGGDYVKNVEAQREYDRMQDRTAVKRPSWSSYDRISAYPAEWFDDNMYKHGGILEVHKQGVQYLGDDSSWESIPFSNIEDVRTIDKFEVGHASAPGIKHTITIFGRRGANWTYIIRDDVLNKNELNQLKNYLREESGLDN